eukprot:5942369-Prymnesium_polylepis.1
MHSSPSASIPVASCAPTPPQTASGGQHQMGVQNSMAGNGLKMYSFMTFCLPDRGASHGLLLDIRRPCCSDCTPAISISDHASVCSLAAPFCASPVLPPPGRDQYEKSMCLRTRCKASCSRRSALSASAWSEFGRRRSCPLRFGNLRRAAVRPPLLHPQFGRHTSPMRDSSRAGSSPTCIWVTGQAVRIKFIEAGQFPSGGGGDRTGGGGEAIGGGGGGGGGGGDASGGGGD